ncbi:MAG: cysteine desulfurase [Spirochaetales bacterium]|nr:cysteine desulfurase [Spirochaetales bacterium]
MDDLEKVHRLRQDFPILNRELAGVGTPRRLVYLDNAATTQKPRSVLDAITAYYETSNANVHRAIHTLGEEATRLYELAREKTRAFLNAEFSEEIIFTRGTTESINLVASSFCSLLNPGDEILLTEMEHHSNLVPWQMAAQRHGLVLKFIPFDPDGVLEFGKLPQLWTSRVRLLALTHTSNVLGTVNPVADFVRFAHERGVPVLVDGAQAAPHRPVDVQALDVDFYAFSSHKMLGPTGLGVLYGKKDWLEKLPPFAGGGEMIRSVTLEGFEPNVLPYKFEAGTPNIEGAVGFAAALDYLGTVGLDWIHGWEQKLTSYALEQIKRVPGLTVYGKAPDRAGVVAFSLEGVHAHDLSAYLDQSGVAVRAGHHCAHPLARKLGVISTARASFYLYNTFEEIDRWIQALEAGAKIL